MWFLALRTLNLKKRQFYRSSHVLLTNNQLRFYRGGSSNEKPSPLSVNNLDFANDEPDDDFQLSDAFNEAYNANLGKKSDRHYNPRQSVSIQNSEETRYLSVWARHMHSIGAWVVDIFSLNENIKFSSKLAIIQRQNRRALC